MKKIILILVILAVLLFSGCDGMLEVFYPELTDEILENYSEENNFLTIEYLIDSATLSTLYDSSIPVKMEIYLNNESPNSGNIPFRTISIYGEYWYKHEFFVPAGNYDIWIWQDGNGDGGIDNGDFVLWYNRWAEPPNYYFSSSGEKDSYYAWEWASW